MITSSYPKIKKQYIKHPKFENLYVIPYIRGRLVFAELAAHALEEDRFDNVVVDFPFFMNSDNLLEMAVQSLPFASSLLIRKNHDSLVAIPFVPNDAACIAVAAVQMLKKEGIPIELKCIDDSHVINYPQESLIQPEINFKDDYMVFTDGLENFFEPLYKQLDQSLNECSEDYRIFSEYRAGIVVERLLKSLRQGGQTLFVCEYRLWSTVSKILETGYVKQQNYFHFAWKDLKAVMVFEDPYYFWAHGLLDDYPFAVEQFYNKFRLGSVRLFDKLDCIEEMVKSSIQRCAKQKKDCLSIRRLVSFYQYLRTMMTGALRFTPQPLSHLYDAAYSCLEKRFAQDMAKQFIRYPYPERKRVRGFLNIREDHIATLYKRFKISDMSEYSYFNTGSRKYSFDALHDGYHSPEDRLKFTYKIYPSADKKIVKSLGQGGFHSWALQTDYLVHEMACGKVREIINRSRCHEITKKSLGSMGEGIHWKRTIISKALGEEALYIKLKSRSRKELKREIDEYTPVVFIFTNDFHDHGRSTIHDSNITQRNIELGNSEFTRGNNPPPDFVYSVFHSFKGGEIYYNGHVEKRELSSVTFLYTRHIMGLKRYAAIMKRTQRFQCRLSPLSDMEVRHFTLPETGVAWAVKYAEHTVIVAAINGWKPSASLADFARSKGVKIYTIPLSDFKQDFIERLRSLYFTSTQVKKHPDMDSIVERFIE